MTALTQSVVAKGPSGQFVVLVAGVEAPDWFKAGDSAADMPEPAGYSAMKVDELKAEIDKRNEGREDADKLSTEGKKAELIAALEADDSK